MDKKDIKYEDAVTRLEEIVASLEKGKCDLDDSLALFEEGVSLVKICTEKLDSAAQKVRMLTGADTEEDGETDD